MEFIAFCSFRVKSNKNFFNNLLKNDIPAPLEHNDDSACALMALLSVSFEWFSFASFRFFKCTNRTSQSEGTEKKCAPNNETASL